LETKDSVSTATRRFLSLDKPRSFWNSKLRATELPFSLTPER